MSEKRILVTGATGLLGSQLLLDLSLKGKNIRAMKRPASNLDVVMKKFSGHEGLLESIEWVDADITDVSEVYDAMQNVSEVYHCTGLVSFDPSERKLMQKINVEGTANIVNVALEAGIRKFCFASSVAALGRANENEVITEKTKWKNSVNNSNYAVTKFLAEREVWRGIAEGLHAVIVNPSIIIGYGDDASGAMKMLNEVRHGLKFYTDGISGFVDVRDVSKAMIALMESEIESKHFIVNGENLPYREVFNMLADGLGKSHPSVHAGKFLSGIAWRAEALKKIFTGKKPLITKETARNAQKKYFYSNKKICETLQMNFISVKKSVEDLCNFLKTEK